MSDDLKEQIEATADPHDFSAWMENLVVRRCQQSGDVLEMVPESADKARFEKILRLRNMGYTRLTDTADMLYADITGLRYKSFSTGKHKGERLVVQDDGSLRSIAEFHLEVWIKEEDLKAIQALRGCIGDPDDYDVYVNGMLQRPGADYVGPDNKGDVRFKYQLQPNDVINVTVQGDTQSAERFITSPSGVNTFSIHNVEPLK